MSDYERELENRVKALEAWILDASNTALEAAEDLEKQKPPANCIAMTLRGLRRSAHEIINAKANA